MSDLPGEQTPLLASAAYRPVAMRLVKSNPGDQLEVIVTLERLLLPSEVLTELAVAYVVRAGKPESVPGYYGDKLFRKDLETGTMPPAGNIEARCALVALARNKKTGGKVELVWPQEPSFTLEGWLSFSCRTAKRSYGLAHAHLKLLDRRDLTIGSV